MIDLHTHLLPGVDDGPASMKAAVRLAWAHVAAGVTLAAATPHVGYSWATAVDELPARLAELQAALAEQEVPLTVVQGAELEASIVADLDDGQLATLTLGGGRWLLLEAPMSGPAPGIDRIVAHLQQRGFGVLLAHPERCPGLHRPPGLLERLAGAGALTQVTAGALSGRFGQAVRQAARGLVDRGLVSIVASDAHDLRRRPPGLRSELEQAGVAEHAERWCRELPATILADGAGHC